MSFQSFLLIVEQDLALKVELLLQDLLLGGLLLPDVDNLPVEQLGANHQYRWLRYTSLSWRETSYSGQTKIAGCLVVLAQRGDGGLGRDGGGGGRAGLPAWPGTVHLQHRQSDVPVCYVDC